VVTLLAMSLNHFSKMLVANPRPFVTAGTHLERWATSPGRAAELVTEFSTPSGHAMAGGAFWGVVFAHATGWWARAACVVAILGTGLSRPYLGVHYVEDVALGWAIGLAIAVVAVRFGDAIADAWNARPLRLRVALAVGASAALWAVTRALGGFGAATGQPSAFVSYAGLLTGVVAAAPLEARHVRLDPRSASPGRRVVRAWLGVALVFGTIVGLDRASDAIAPDATPLGDLLRFVRYAAASAAGLLAAPWLAVRLGLAERTQA
jgi:hypothetical protein